MTISAKLEPIENRTLRERVRQELKTALMAGRFVPGETVTVRSVAEALGTSPMPVREAIHALVAEHALEMRPNRTVRVPVLSASGFLQVEELRVMLESKAAAMAAARVTEPELAEIAGHNESMAASLKAGDSVTFLCYNQSFHFAIYRAAGNAFLLSVIESCWLRVGPYLMSPFASGRERVTDHYQVGVSFHDPIIAALKAHDVAAAEATMAADVAQGTRWYGSVLEFAPEE
ncbi:MAG: GntR family transcriptional regulator [Alphaproteobacteria bacterium]|nr:GntR family transcriptional regulator [Alphaproteobacteria bacterium]